MGERDKPTPANEGQRRAREEKHSPPPAPETLEGPGGRDEAKAKEDARDKATRRGES